MAFFFGLQDTLLDFFEKGGGVVVFISFLIVLMWSFILERFWYFKYIHNDVEIQQMIGYEFLTFIFGDKTNEIVDVIKKNY